MALPPPGTTRSRPELSPEEIINLLQQVRRGKLSVQGAVERLSGLYHGHGVWFRLAKER